MTEPKYYLVTEDEMNWIKNDCAKPNIPYCEGCEYTSDGDNPCTWKGANILMDEIIETRLYNPQAERDRTINEFYDRLKVERDPIFDGVSWDDVDAVFIKLRKGEP